MLSDELFRIWSRAQLRTRFRDREGAAGGAQQKSNCRFLHSPSHSFRVGRNDRIVVDEAESNAGAKKIEEVAGVDRLYEEIELMALFACVPHEVVHASLS